MTIINGYKITHDNYYTFAENEIKAKEAAKNNDWSEYELIPCRYSKQGKYSYPVMINEDNKIETLYKLFERPFIQVVENTVNQWQNPIYFIWDNVIEAGKSYLVGKDEDTKKFIKSHTTQLSDWQVLAHEYVKENPDKKIRIDTKGKRKFSWVIFLEGDHVIIELPHHDAGGEKTWVSHIDTPNKKVLVNVD